MAFPSPRASHRPDPRLALPRRPELTVLHAAVSGHLLTFLARAEERGGVPSFVEGEMRRYLQCGIPAHGFLRVRCEGCGHDRLVAFSCKGRGFCPSCGGRRMAAGAAHLVDRVLPAVPVRQWVLSLPFALRFALARDHELLTAVLRVAMRCILGAQEQRARRRFGVSGRCGAVTAVQRFGGALNLNLHFHAIVLDGVHVRGPNGRLSFRALPPPRPAERLAWTESIARRVTALLRRRGLLDEDLGGRGGEPSTVLDACQAASMGNVVAMGPRAGRPLRKIVLPGLAKEAEAPTHEGRGVNGFDLDVGPVIRAADRARLERLCRYLLRPALAADRLEQLPDGRLKYVFRHPWRDGTTAVVMEPLDLLARLAALVPAPRRHLLRYHGTLAPNAAWRARIVPEPAAQASPGEPSCGSPSPSSESSYIPWAELLRRVFAEDVLSCVRCGGRMKIIATVTDLEAVKKILTCIGLSARPPPVAPARERQQADLTFGD